MGGKSQWDVSSNGPDWTDVSAVMRAVGDLHNVVITFCLGNGAFDGPSLYGVLSAISVPKEGTVLGQPILSIQVEYPCKDHKEITACVYAALLQMDYVLTSKVWDQSQLPFTAD